MNNSVIGVATMTMCFTCDTELYGCSTFWYRVRNDDDYTLHRVDLTVPSFGTNVTLGPFASRQHITVTVWADDAAGNSGSEEVAAIRVFDVLLFPAEAKVAIAPETYSNSPTNAFQVRVFPAVGSTLFVCLLTTASPHRC